MLDYDKKYLISSYDNLTFDGSSVKGFSEVNDSDLRLEIDWGSFRWLPTGVFGPGKVIIFAYVKSQDDQYYSSDMRGRLKQYTDELYEKHGYITNIAVECEGFLLKNINAEQRYNSRDGFELVSRGGYFNSLPNDHLKIFIDEFADAKRAMGFENEKDHPEVAPSQFELNYKYTEALIAADQVQLYKLLARQVAANQGYTASFLPKPIANINGNGMHTNISISDKNNKNLFYEKTGEHNLSDFAWGFIDKVLSSANDLCLTLNSSVNAYRRLDPAYEAPNQIKSSAVDRTAMIRVPIGNEKSARVEVRTVAPDSNPYLAFYSLLKAGLEGPITKSTNNEIRKGTGNYLPSNIYDASEHFIKSNFMAQVLGKDVQRKYYEQKVDSANRCPRELGKLVKSPEILFHHEVTNQHIWADF
jgi:glutamine synthetase